ncbi:MAG: SLC13 family permease [Thermoplasmata archaeon]
MPTNPVGLAVFVLIFGAVIVRQIVGRGPGIWLIFGLGAIATIGLWVVTPSDGLAALEAGGPILIFLVALFLFAGGLERSGALEHAARWLLHRAKQPEDLPWYLFVGFGLASAFILNDALILIAIPILFSIARRLEIDPKPLLLTVAFAVTVGSALTPMGNPQNLLISISSGMAAPVTTYLEYLLLPIVAALILGGLYLRHAFTPQLRGARERHAALRTKRVAAFPRGGWARRLREHPVLIVFPATIGLVVGLELATSIFATPGIAIWVPCAVGAGLLLAITPGRTAIVRAVDLRILVLFAGLFVVVAGALSAGIISAVERGLPIAGPGQPTAGLLGIAATSLAGPQLFSNVPWVALQIPALSHLGYGPTTPLAWVTLGAASTLAGNITILGAASNLILVERVERLGVRIRLGEFARSAIPIAAISVGLTLLALLAGL